MARRLSTLPAVLAVLALSRLLAICTAAPAWADSAAVLKAEGAYAGCGR